MMCDDNPSVSKARSMTYVVNLISIIAFFKVWGGGGNIVTCTHKITKFHGQSTMSVTVLPIVVRQEPVC